MQQEKKMKVTCFGNFEVTFPENDFILQWRTKKAKELFAYLIHMQGSYVDRSVLYEKLWTEKEEDYNAAALHNILYNIRKRLEPWDMREALECKKSKYRINRTQVDSDLDKVQLMTGAVEAKDIKKLFQYRDVLQGFQGTYMGGVSGEWHMEWAEYYEQTFIKGCFMLAEASKEEGKAEEAIQYLKVGLTIDPYGEKLSGLLIRCYGDLRDFKNMKKLYKKYTELLRQDLGIEHSKILETAYIEQIRKKQE